MKKQGEMMKNHSEKARKTLGKRKILEKLKMSKKIKENQESKSQEKSWREKSRKIEKFSKKVRNILTVFMKIVINISIFFQNALEHVNCAHQIFNNRPMQVKAMHFSYSRKESISPTL